MICQRQSATVSTPLHATVIEQLPVAGDQSIGETGDANVVGSTRSRSSIVRRTLQSEPVSRIRFSRNAIIALNDLAHDNFFNIFTPDDSISNDRVHKLLDRVLH
jgi:hypothetical protein